MIIRAYHTLQRVRNRAFTVAARGSFGDLGAGTNLQLPIHIGSPQNINLGSRVQIRSGANLISYGGVIAIGDGSIIYERVTITAQSSVTIGDRVMVGRNSHISDHDHQFDHPDIAIMDQGMRTPRPVVIEDGAWIGHGVVVMPGVRIGRNAVIGANSVVTRDVPDHAVAVGQPAKAVVRVVGVDATRDGDAITAQDR